MSFETHGSGASTQLFAGKRTAVIGLYEWLTDTSTEQQKFSKADLDAIVDRWGHLPLTGTGEFTLRDCFDAPIQAGMVNPKEGVAQGWSWVGRFVFLGDAAHKFTPITGAGFNDGVVDVVALANELARIVVKLQPGSRENGHAQVQNLVESAFEAYQMDRQDLARGFCFEVGLVTALATWTSRPHEFIDRYVLGNARVQFGIAMQRLYLMRRMPV